MSFFCFVLHRVQKSDAGVGIGMLTGDRNYLAQNREIGKKRFMFFDRNEIHIQAFVHSINEKLMSGHSSSSTFHHFQEFIISNYHKFRSSKFQIFKFRNFKNPKVRYTGLPKILKK